MANCEEFLQRIGEDTKLNSPFFLKIYGYEISYPGFSDEAIKKLEMVGCKKARMYYENAVAEYETKYRESVKAALAKGQRKRRGDNYV